VSNGARRHRVVVRLLAALVMLALGWTWWRSPSPKRANTGCRGFSSGEDMPTRDSPGWHLMLTDAFSGPSLSDRWFTYDGQPSGDAFAWFASSHVTEKSCGLQISAYKDPAHANMWTSGGISSTLSQTYGKVLIRMRLQEGHGVAVAALLWPSDNSSLPEVDFAEDNGADRKRVYSTLHYGPESNSVQHSVAVNLSLWHTYGVEWTPGKLVYLLDGHSWSIISGSSVPSKAMRFAVQTQAWDSNNTWEWPVDSTTPTVVNLTVAWVAEYAISSRHD
jgi:beta-glucanase (GH16 family)